jgi:hypothetical protein
VSGEESVSILHCTFPLQSAEYNSFSLYLHWVKGEEKYTKKGRGKTCQYTIAGSAS